MRIRNLKKKKITQALIPLHYQFYSEEKGHIKNLIRATFSSGDPTHFYPLKYIYSDYFTFYYFQIIIHSFGL